MSWPASGHSATHPSWPHGPRRNSSSLPAGRASIEICPGTFLGQKRKLRISVLQLAGPTIVTAFDWGAALHPGRDFHVSAALPHETGDVASRSTADNDGLGAKLYAGMGPGSFESSREIRGIKVVQYEGRMQQGMDETNVNTAERRKNDQRSKDEVIEKFVRYQTRGLDRPTFLRKLPSVMRSRGA